MATQAQIDANRANAKKSTGPKSPDGKEKVAQNALKHGLLARRFFIGPEQEQAFADFRDALTDDLNPVGPFQTALVERIADLAWRLKQSRSIYNAVLNAMIQKNIKSTQNTFFSRPVSQFSLDISRAFRL